VKIIKRVTNEGISILMIVVLRDMLILSNVTKTGYNIGKEAKI